MTSFSHVKGWIIDFRTASSVFASGSNARINAFIEMVENSQLWIAHCEKDLFKKDTKLQPVFVDGQQCIIVPDSDIYTRSLAITKKKISKKLLNGNDSAIMLGATAASYQYGILSDHKSGDFLTVSDICDKLGIPTSSTDKFFGN